MLTRQRARRTADRAGARAATRSSRRCPRRPSARRRPRARCAGRRSGCSPCRLPTFVCSSSLDGRQALEVVRVAEDGQAVAHERLAQRVLAARRPSSRDRPRRAGARSSRRSGTRARRGRARTMRAPPRARRACVRRAARRAASRSTTAASARADAVDVAGLEALLARGLRDRLGLLARDGDQRCALLARALEELVHPAEAARAGRTAACRARAAAGVVRGGDGWPAGACPQPVRGR